MSAQLPQGLYGITDPSLLPGENLFRGVESALRGGCRIIQYRDKQNPFNTCLENAKRLKDLCDAYKACFIINDNLKLALSCDADGLHIGKSDATLLSARKSLGDDKIIGITCHSDLNYAREGIQSGATYCAFGRFFDSNTKPDAPPCDMATLKQALSLTVPVVAIGGIDVDNISRFRDTPPHNIAVINSLFASDDIEQTAQKLAAAFTHLYTF
jgi:thiamine-phosphate pyrophosphorylase